MSFILSTGGGGFLVRGWVSHFSEEGGDLSFFRGGWGCHIFQRGVSPTLEKMEYPLQYSNTANARSVRILLECILVLIVILSNLKCFFGLFTFCPRIMSMTSTFYYLNKYHTRLVQILTSWNKIQYHCWQSISEQTSCH